MDLTLPALVAPFCGERYRAELNLSDVLAPPYDVISPAERSALAARHAYNVVRIILPEGDGDRYQRAAALLEEWRRRAVLVPDPGEGLYVVRQRFALASGAWHQRTGLLAAVAAERFGGGRVKPHERTHAGPKADRLALMRATGTMCEALLMLCRDTAGVLQERLAVVTASKPLVQGELAGVEVTLWRVHGGEAAELASAAAAEPLYIADGHHRYETAVAYRGENPKASHTLALIVPMGDPGLVVLPTHRLVGGRPVGTEAVAALAERFTVQSLAQGADLVGALETLPARGECLLVLRDGAYRLARRGGTVPPELNDLAPPVRALDVAWADHLVVPVLRRMAGEEPLRYTSDAAAALAALARGEAGAAVLLRPPTVADVLAVADAGAFMPPKATYFTPKVPSGLVFLRYEGTGPAGAPLPQNAHRSKL